jgi:MFS family permease
MLHRMLPGVYEGWLIVGSMAFMIVVTGGAFAWGFGTVFTPIKEEFAWSAAATSVAFALRSEVSGVAAPFIGYLIDRFGPRLVFLGGVVVAATGMLLMSWMQNLWQFYATMVAISTGISAVGGPVGMVAIATWFERRRARALSLMTVGGAFAGFAVVPVAWMTEEFGWRTTLRVLAAVILATGLLTSTNLRLRPASHHQPLDGFRAVDGELPRERTQWGVPVMRAVRSRAFLMLSLVQMAVFFGISALIVHQIPYMESLGISTTTAGSVVAFFALFSLVGRLGAGWLADKYDKRVVLAGCVALTCAGVPLLAVAQTLPQIIAVMMLIAPGFGGMVPLRPAIIADYFGTRSFGTLNGVSMFIVSMGAAIAPVLVGRAVDVTGEYTVGWLLAGAISLIGIPALLAMRPPDDLIAEFRDPVPERPTREAVTA